MSMKLDDVLAIVGKAEQNNITLWLDGGWGVDALTGHQTREHEDLDVAIKVEDVERFRAMLYEDGFKDYEDELPTRLDLQDGAGRQIDLHPITMQANGDGLQQLQDGTFGRYSAQGLSGIGKLGGEEVKCLSPEIQVHFHTGYTPDEKDYIDVKTLCETFDIALPEEYTHFHKDS